MNKNQIAEFACLCLEHALQNDFLFLVSPNVASSQLLTKFTDRSRFDISFFQWSGISSLEMEKSLEITHQDLVSLNFTTKRVLFKVTVDLQDAKILSSCYGSSDNININMHATRF
jgi:hypothetical protein